jgi:hypothetical protein
MHRLPNEQLQQSESSELEFDENLHFGHADFKVAEKMCNVLRRRKVDGQIQGQIEAWETEPHMLITMLESEHAQLGNAFQNRAAALRWHPDKWLSEEENALATKVFQLHREVFDRQRLELASRHGDACVHMPPATAHQKWKGSVFSVHTECETPPSKSQPDLHTTSMKTFEVPERACVQER